jgi:hypothetical protein
VVGVDGARIYALTPSYAPQYGLVIFAHVKMFEGLEATQLTASQCRNANYR